MSTDITYHRGETVEYRHTASGTWRPATVESVRARDNAVMVRRLDGGADVAPASDVRPAVRPGQVVTGRKFGGKRTMTVQVTQVLPDAGVVVGLLAYASTFTAGGQYEGSFRGVVALDASTVEVQQH